MNLLPRLFAIAAFLAVPPVSAQESFVNSAMGFEVRLPDGYVRTYADNEMAVFKSVDGTREIALLGGNSFDPLERLAERHMSYDEQDGWTTRLLSSTPSWAAYAGSRNGQQMVVRMIEICPRWQFARLQVTYPDRDAVEITPMLDSLGASFRPTGTALCK